MAVFDPTLEQARSRTMQKFLAVMTMVYNEIDFLPIWLRHYAAAVGPENCYVLDHGSTDGSTDNLGRVNVIRIPRSPMDEERRCKFISEFCSSMLTWYDAFAYTDVDEMLVADPAVAPDLVTLSRNASQDVLTAFGVNVLHRMGHDLPLTGDQPISAQRRWIYPTAAMAKPLIIRRAVNWPPGFHSYDGPPVFCGLFNMHLAQVDYDIALRRQAKRRSVQWATAIEKFHPHKADDSAVYEDFMRWSSKPIVEDVVMNETCRHYRRFRERISLSANGREGLLFQIEMNIWSRVLWLMPERFVGIF